MALDSYANLQVTIAGWLNRTDLTARVPDFITLAEAQIGRRLLQMGPVRRMTGRSDASISTEFAAVPTDFMGVRAFYMTETNVRQLTKCDPEQIVEKKGATTDLTGPPQFFAVVGDEFQFFPAPDDTYTAELTYWKAVPALSDDNTTNWVLAYHPDAYLYGALLQSAPYLQDDERTQLWESAFATVLADIVAADKIERDAPYLTIPDVAGGTP